MFLFLLMRYRRNRESRTRRWQSTRGYWQATGPTGEEPEPVGRRFALREASDPIHFDQKYAIKSISNFGRANSRFPSPRRCRFPPRAAAGGPWGPAMHLEPAAESVRLDLQQG